MPDTRSLALMRRRLEQAMRPGPVLLADPWVDPMPIRQARREVERQFDGVGEMPSGPSLRQAVLRFSETGTADSFTHLKYVCYGVTLPLDDKNQRLIDSEDTFARLLKQVDGHKNEARRFRRCYQALMQSYFALEPSIQGSEIGLTDGGKTLRGFLSNRLEFVAQPAAGKLVPAWVLTLKDHQNLLTDRPCDRYVRELQAGRTDELTSVCEALGISSNSWVWQAVILAYLREICERPDDRFKAAIGNALDLAEGKAGVAVSPPVARFVVASLVKRYKRSAAHPELPRLRDAALERIGNPWLHRPRWDAWVEDEGARQMVDGWLKSRLIEDFFSLLSDQIGGATDQRRLSYWLRFVPAIEDMWFVLGGVAARSSAAEFVEMRRRMDGRWSHLTGGTDARNNAFIMRAGGHFFIEFGMKNHACYYYEASNLPFDPNSPTLSIYRLKGGHKSKSHTHQWEAEFDRTFCPLMGYWPGQATGRPPSPQRTSRDVDRLAPSTRAQYQRPVSDALTHGGPNPMAIPRLAPGDPAPALGRVRNRDDLLREILRVCRLRRIEVDDRRDNSGSLRVGLARGKHHDLETLLDQCGFRYSERLKQYYLRADT